MISGTYTYFMNQSAAHANQKTMYNTSRLEGLHSSTLMQLAHLRLAVVENAYFSFGVDRQGKLLACKFRAKRGTNAIDLGSWGCTNLRGIVVACFKGSM